MFRIALHSKKNTPTLGMLEGVIILHSVLHSFFTCLAVSSQ
jgi:hypothetical protein